MRNLKKVLSLALALVMLLGMMVVGAGAATSFKDDDKIDNQVAVAVSNKIGVLVGDENGNFNPDGTLTRAEAAVAIARLDLGTSAANALAATNAATFKDVPVSHWGKPYIDYCAGNGYIVGDGNGNFNPNKTVTSVEFATMVSRMLGYDTKVEGIEGNADWAVKAAALARKAGLSTNVLLTTASPMDRDDMAQMVFNSLTAPLVEYEGLNVSVNGVSLTSNVKVRTHTGSSTASGNRYTYNGEVIKSNITPIRLCEEKFPDLRLTSDEDAFGRVESVWTWKYVNIAGSEEVVTANFEFTEKKSSVSLNGAKGDSDTVVKIDGKPQDTTGKTIDAKYVASLTHNGRLVQVFLNDEDYTEIDKIIVINTYVGQISAVNSAKETVTINVKSRPENNTKSPVTTFDNTELTVGDIVAYTAAYASDGKYYIQDADALEPTVTDVLTKWAGSSVINTEKGKADSNFTVNGETYKYSVNNCIDDEDGNPMDNGIAGFTVNQSEINVYLDKYNFALYVSGVESEKNYAAVIGLGSSNTHGSERRGVTLLLPDGTIKEVTAQMSDWSVMSAIDHGNTADNQYIQSNLRTATTGDQADKNLVSDGVADIVTYSIGDNDVYKLTLVGEKNRTATDATAYKVWSGKYDMSTNTTSNTTFTNGKSVMTLMSKCDGTAAGTGEDGYHEANGAGTGTYYTTSKTIFMIATQNGKGAFGGRSYNVYTGYANAPTLEANQIKGLAFATNRLYTTQIDVVYIDAVKVSNIAGPKTYFVLDGSDVYTTNEGKYYELPAVVDGELTTIKIDAQTAAKWDKDGVKSGTDIGLDTADLGLYAIDSVGINSKGIIESCARVDFEPSASGVGTVRDRYDVLGVGKTIDGKSTVYWSCTNDAKFFYVNKDLELAAIALGDIMTDSDDLVYGMLGDEGRKISVAFVQEVEPDTTTYTLGASAHVLFSSNGGTSWVNSLDNVAPGTTIKVKAEDGYMITSASATANGLGTAVAGVYTITAKNIAAGAIATEVDTTVPEFADVVNQSAVNASSLNLKNNASVAADGKLSLPVVDGKSIPDQAEAALKALGYTTITRKGNNGVKYTYEATDSDGFKRDIEVIYNDGTPGSNTITKWYPVTVNGATTPVAYIKSDTNAVNVPVAKPSTNAGTGLMKGTTYEAYAASNKYTVNGADNAVDIKTGYVTVDTPTTNFVVTPTSAFAATYKVGSATASSTKPTSLPAGSTLQVILTVAGADISLDADASADTVTVATGTGKLEPTSIVCSDAAKVDTNAGGMLTFKTDAGLKLAVGTTVTVTYTIGNNDIDGTHAISVVYAA